MSETPLIVEHAEAAYEAIRSICHDVPAAVPAPHLYRVLGDLKNAAGYTQAEALGKLASALERSLSEYDVYEDDGADPKLRVKSAVKAMRLAAEHASKVGEALDAAQTAINRQGYRD
ncbi:hypothetical protein [Tersicoccus sp. Bi-70]|uniref:hypothetical protein n=1 Tax=Tersicoccus sp. Bi-70 TaxID=1897634 RepID=UPI000978C9EF|nr:hypothetical protein [Tersicoccus sp. Bi-70]OMH37108.1 hypothetical protein BGP79_15630 [Tersicoccus sp. Bi-70]